MSVSIAEQHYEFVCRKCGRKRRARFVVPYPVKKSEAAKRVGYKNTSHGPQCIDGPNGGCESTFGFVHTLKSVAMRSKPADAVELDKIAKWFKEHQ